MKRFFCLFLALLLLAAAGCAPHTPAPAEPDSAPSEQLTEPSETETEPSTAAEQTPPDGLAFSLPALPEIGAYYTGEKTEPFFASGPADVFTPREDYGQLSLYYADVTYYRDTFGETSPDWSEAGYRCDYGLMTADGKVVTGAKWTEGYELSFSETAGCYLLQESKPNGKETAGIATDLIALDGSWAMHLDRYASITTLYRYGLPYFVIDTQPDGTVYDVRNGKQALSLKEYVRTDPDSGYSWLPNIVYADKALLLLQTDSEWQADTEKNTYTALDWNGNALYTKTLTGRGLMHFGGSLITESASGSSRTYRLCGNDLEPVNDYAYENVLFDDATGCTLAFRFNGEEVAADYFDADGNAVSPDTGWSALTPRDVKELRLRRSANGSVFVNDDEDRFLDFFGRDIPLPSPAAFTKLVEDYENDVLYIYEHCEDGSGCLCAADGTPLLRLDAPYEYQNKATDSRAVSLFVNNGFMAAAYEDGRFRVFDLTARKETYSGVLEDVFPAGTGVDDIGSYNYWFLPCGLLCTWKYGTYRVYDAHTMRQKYPGAVSAVARGKLALIATPTESVALDADGNVLVRVIIDKNV